MRNLIYYAYFNISNIPNYIYQHIFLLKKYRDVFDGEKIIYIATDDDITSEVEIKLKSYFNFLNATITVVKNNPETRESEYFIQQLKDLKETKKDGSITFYAHTKGSTYDTNDNILKWIVSMYFFNLESQNLLNIESNLENKIFAGIFRIDFPCPPWVIVNWHYSGTFFWFSDKLFDIDTWDINPKDRFSVESYPGSKCNIEQSYTSENLFNDYINSTLIGTPYNRYDIRYDIYWKVAFSENEKVIPRDKLDRFNKLIDDIKIDDIKRLISVNPTAWSGHFDYAIELTRTLNPSVVVELGVDYGYSIFAFAYPRIGNVYGIDWFYGDDHAGSRNTYTEVMRLKGEVEEMGIDNITIVPGDFNNIAKIWAKPIDILHIDGLHTYEAVKNDFETWSKFLSPNGVILFHDVECYEGVHRFFNEIDGYKIYRTMSCGLGVFTKSLEIYQKIKLI